MIVNGRLRDKAVGERITGVIEFPGGFRTQYEIKSADEGGAEASRGQHYQIALPNAIRTNYKDFQVLIQGSHQLAQSGVGFSDGENIYFAVSVPGIYDVFLFCNRR